MTENTANNIADNDNGISSCLLPNFCEVGNLFIVVLLTEVLAIIFAMTASSSGEQFWDYLALSSLLMIWIALLNVAVLCKLRDWLHTFEQNRCLFITFCLMMGIRWWLASPLTRLETYFIMSIGVAPPTHYF